MMLPIRSLNACLLHPAERVPMASGHPVPRRRTAKADTTLAEVWREVVRLAEVLFEEVELAFVLDIESMNRLHQRPLPGLRTFNHSRTDLC